MTGNQIAFWGLQESRRHNQAVEAETVRYNTEYLAEMNRHNTASEIELNRHNLAYESETTRHNKVVEKETERSNRANEAIRWDQNRIQEWYNKASIGLGYSQLEYQKTRDALNLEYQYKALAETTRHNKELEGAQRVKNRNELVLGQKNLDETARYHDQQYDLGQRNLGLGFSKLGFDYASLGESKRSNRAREATNERLADIQQQRADTDQFSARYSAALGTVDSLTKIGLGVSKEGREWADTFRKALEAAMNK